MSTNTPCSSHYDCGAGGFFFCDTEKGFCREPKSDDIDPNGAGAQCGDEPEGGPSNGSDPCSDQNCPPANSCGDGAAQFYEPECCGGSPKTCSYTDDEGNPYQQRQCHDCDKQFFCIDSSCEGGGDFVRYKNGYRVSPWRCADGSAVIKKRVDLEPGKESSGCSSPCGCGQERVLEEAPVEPEAPIPPPCPSGTVELVQADGSIICADFNECDQYYHEYFKTYGHLNGTNGTLNDICSECQDCVNYGASGSACEPADVDNFDVIFGDHPCYCASGNDACEYCEHCNDQSGECEQRGGQDCVTECNCQLRCPCGVTVAGVTTQPYFFDGARDACPTECRAELQRKCDEICTDADPCEKNCKTKAVWISCGDTRATYQIASDNCADGKKCTYTGSARIRAADNSYECSEGGQYAVYIRECDTIGEGDPKELREDCGGCDCNCFDDCGDCEICGEDGQCAPDPACYNRPCYSDLSPTSGVSGYNGPCEFGCCPTEPWTLESGNNTYEMEGCEATTCATYYVTTTHPIWKAAGWFQGYIDTGTYFYATKGSLSWTPYVTWKPAPEKCNPDIRQHCCDSWGINTYARGCGQYHCDGCYSIDYLHFTVNGTSITYWSHNSEGAISVREVDRPCCLYRYNGVPNNVAGSCLSSQCPGGMSRSS